MYDYTFFVYRYKKLEDVLSFVPPYSDPVFLNDFAPTHPDSCYTSYIHQLALPFSVEYYSYAHGNNLGTLWYLWRILESKCKISTKQNISFRRLNLESLSQGKCVDNIGFQQKGRKESTHGPKFPPPPPPPPPPTLPQ